jgi:hypothetical protein
MNLSRLRRAKLARPTAYVECPELKGWLFSEEEEPRFKVRGLNANEQLLAREETAKQERLRRTAQQIQPGTPNGEAVKEALLSVIGIAQGEHAQSLPYLIQLLLWGVIDEDGKRIFDHEVCAILHEHFPSTFLTLTNKIAELMGQPSEPALGERSRLSGQTPGSESRSPSVNTSDSPSTDRALISFPTTPSPQ